MIVQSIFYAALLVLAGYGIVSLLKIKIQFDLGEQFIYSILVGTVILVLVPYLVGLSQGFTIIMPLVIVISAGLSVFSIYKLTGEVISYFTSEREKTEMTNSDQRTERFLQVTIGGLLAGILFLQIILPLRGYDALWMYFTSSYVIYLTDSIPLVNYLTFQPFFKEPVLLLLYAGGIYLTSDFSLIFLPILFTCGNAVLVYLLTKEFTKNHQLRLFAVLIYLVMPFTKWMVDSWAYYQDLYLEFFFTLTVFLFLKTINKEQGAKTAFYTTMTGLAFSLTILTKINGLTLIVVLLLLAPLPRKYERTARAMFVVVIAGIFCLLVATRIYIGFLLPIAVYALILLLSGVRYYSNVVDKQKITSLLAVLMVGFGIGLTWLIELRSRLPEVFDSQVIEQYFSLENAAKLSFPSLLETGNEIHIEIGHGVNFWTSGFLFFLGTFFTTFWLIPKIFGLIGTRNIPAAMIWLFSYLVIWTAYYANSSLRYLSPIHAPTAILVAVGIFKIWEHYNKNESPSVIYMLFWGFLACLNYYYLISPELLIEYQSKINSIGEAFNQSTVWFNNNPFILLLLGIIPAGILLFYFKWSPSVTAQGLFQNDQLKRTLTMVLIIVIIVVPIIVPVVVLTTVDFDLARFQQTYVYDSRPAAREVVNFIIQDNKPTSCILAVNFPNLAYLTQQPVLDLYQQREPFQPIFENQNATEALTLIQDPFLHLKQQYPQIAAGFSDLDQLNLQVKYIVVPSSNHYWYSYYKKNLYNVTYFFRLLNNNLYFDLSFNNTEFYVYQPIFENQTFSGIVDVFLTDGRNSSTLMRIIEEELAFNEAPELKILLDLQMIDTSNVSISARANFTLNTNIFQNIEINTSVIPNSFIELNFGKLPINSRSLNWMNIKISYYQNNIQITNNYDLYTIAEPMKYSATDWTVFSGTGFLINQ
jgi:hypothetical protein